MSAWQDFMTAHRIGDAVEATVTRVVPFGALVDVEGVPGLLTGIAQGDVTVGDRIGVRVAATDPARERVSVTAR